MGGTCASSPKLRVLDARDVVHLLGEYAGWAATVAAEDSTIDRDGLLSGSHALQVLLERFANGERSITHSFGHNIARATVEFERTLFVEYRDGGDGSLAGLLVADALVAEAPDSPVRILRVLVKQEFRSDGECRPSPSVMTQLGHRLISHAIRCRSSPAAGPPVRVDFTLANVACVMAHAEKWRHIFETYQIPSSGTRLHASFSQCRS